MPQHVKPKRRYDSPRRREQAEATRLAILDAAGRLFVRDGYPATTMAAIAAEAGVALKTVYLAFDTKSGVLRALWNLRLRGDQEETPIGQRPWYVEVMEESDPERKLRLGTRGAVAVRVRIGGLYDVIQGAALTDPEIAALWERIQSEFHANLRAVVEDLARRKQLAASLDVERATDILWLLNHPSTWLLLTGRCGWTPDEYEDWVFESARAQLLASARKQRR